MPYTYKQPGNWKTTRRRILKRDNGTCACGALATQVDHIIPVTQGGTHDDANLRAICETCHEPKTHSEQRAGKVKRSTKRPAERHPGRL